MPGPQRTNLKGRRFGALKVLDFDDSRPTGLYWHCRCDCGQANCRGEISVKATRLMRRLTEHCGALGYRRDAERHKIARAKVPAAKRRRIAKLGAKARLVARQDQLSPVPVR